MSNEEEILSAFLWARECVEKLLKVRPVCEGGCHCRYCTADHMLSVTGHIDASGVTKLTYVEVKGLKDE